MTIYKETLQSPIGELEITAAETGIQSIYFVDQASKPAPNPLTQMAVEQLEEYFSGQRTDFDLPLAPIGTAFQQRVWQRLCMINYGDTCSYTDIANAINKPKAVRAVGAANGRNPLTIVVPCHRVVGRDGSLTGYAFGIQRKAWLLKHESGH